MKSEKAKVLHALLGRPLCFYPITRVLELGASPVVAVIGHQADQAKATLEALFPGRPLRFALQKEQNGTAGAVRAAEAELQGRRAPILILYGDLPLVRTETLQSLIDVFHSGKSKLALTAMKLDDPTGYGRLVRFRGAITRVVEHKDCTPAQLRISECNAGIYVVDAAFLWKSIHQTKSSNAQRELYLTDLVEMAAADGEVASITVSAEEAAGVNDRQDLAAAGAVLQSRINSHLMRSGVTLVDPRSTFIAEGIDIGPDTEIAPMVTVFGQSRIGSNVRIGQGCVVINSEIADETELHPYCVMNGAQIGRRCSIGPFARLRPGSQLEEAVHLGNFVETKKTRIGKGSKANHLSYLGDAEIGAGVNVGAGTITCNYDGEHKYKTVLGDGVFVGSDTQFVAPVTVGEGAYIAAGTTVTEDVPARSLVLSRTRQTVKEGWVDAKKAKKGEGASQKSGQMGESRSTPASEHPVRASEPPKR